MLVYVLIFIIGALVGSFLNVIICRLPEKRSIIKERSKCPHCKVAIKFFDLIPILSFFILRGRCRECKKAISWQYPLVEFITGALFVFLAVQYQMAENFANPFFFRDLVFTAALIIIFVTDLRFYLIFDAVAIPMMFFAVIMNVFLFSHSGNYLETLSYIVLAGAVVGAFFYLQYFFSKGKWIGRGDIQMGLLMGFMLGWPKVLLALFLAYIIGALVSVVLLCLKKKTMKSQVPFGVFLSLAAFIGLVLGELIIDWYLNLLI